MPLRRIPGTGAAHQVLEKVLILACPGTRKLFEILGIFWDTGPAGEDPPGRAGRFGADGDVPQGDGVRMMQ